MTGAVAARLALALACVAVAAWVLVTRWAAVLHGHPAYPVLLALLVVAGVLVAVRAGRPRTGTAPRRIGRIVAGLLLALVAGGAAWLRPFPADDVAVAATADSAEVTVVETPTAWELRPRRAPLPVGVVLHPGARVDPRAYLRLLRSLAELGHLVVVPKPPLGLALLSVGATTGAFDDHPEVLRWVVGGHSLGGTAAALASDPREVGLLLWASYPAGDVSGSGLAVLSVSGDRDGLATPAGVDAARPLMPPDTTYVVVAGGVHAYFGDYGPQPDDGVAAVGREEAQRQIVAATVAFVRGR